MSEYVKDLERRVDALTGDVIKAIDQRNEARKRIEELERENAVLIAAVDRHQCERVKELEQALRMMVNATDDAMESPKEAASWARTGDMQGYIDKARAVLEKGKCHTS